jgi:poly(3-hydroxyalkanoate) depolymerase
LNTEEIYRDIGNQRLRILTSLDRPGTPLLIFNGIGASAGMLRPLLMGLKNPAFTFDLPGVGASSQSLLPRRMPQLAKLARDVLKDLGISRCHVMGISWGGGLAQQFARQYPQHTDRLVLAATSTGHLMVPPRLAVMAKMATPVRYLSAGYFRRIAGDIYGGDFRNDQHRAAQHAKMMTPPSIVGYVNQLFALTGWTSLFWLHRITAPAMVLAGEDDPIIPLVNARLLSNRLPDSRLFTYDCGHLFVLTRLEEVSADINAFLEEGSGPALNPELPAGERPRSV